MRSWNRAESECKQAGGQAGRVFLTALLVGGAVLVGCKRDQAASAPALPAAMMAPAVGTAIAKTEDVPLYLDEIGRATAAEAVTITPRIAGQIIERNFEDGADLKKGQVLFVIDRAPTEAALASTQAQLAQSKASLDFANIELQRYQSVAGTQAISKSDFDTKKNAVDVANAQVASAEAAVRTAQINLDFCTIKSPIDGRAGSRMVDVGNVVKENEGQLLSVQKLDPIYADFTVNEGQVTQVRDFMASGSLKTMVRLPTDTDAGREGTLTFLDNSVQESTGTIKLRATLPNSDHHFWPGQFVDARLILKVLKDAVIIPNTAQQVSQQGLFVFRVDADEKSPTHLTANQVPVVFGQQQPDGVVVSKGINAGDKVVISGQLLLQPGAPVNDAAAMQKMMGGPGGPGGAPATQQSAAGDEAKRGSQS